MGSSTPRFVLPARKAPLRPFRWWRLIVLCVALILWGVNAWRLDVLSVPVNSPDNRVLLSLLEHAGKDAPVSRPLRSLQIVCLGIDAIPEPPKVGVFYLLAEKSEGDARHTLVAYCGGNVVWQLPLQGEAFPNMEAVGKTPRQMYRLTLSFTGTSSTDGTPLLDEGQTRRRLPVTLVACEIRCGGEWVLVPCPG